MNERLSKEEVLDRIDEYRIYERYWRHNFKLGALYPSPFRNNDDSGSFNVFAHRNQNKLCKLYYKDLGDNNFHGDVFQFVMDITGYSFPQALQDIVGNFQTNFKNSNLLQRVQIEEQRFKELSIVPQRYKAFDLEWWEQWAWDLEMLRLFNVYSTAEVFVDNDLRYTYVPTQPIYTFKVRERFKVYRPLEKNKRYKWLSNLTKGDIFGYKQLPPKGEICLLTSSLKDVGTCRALGFPAVASISENSGYPRGFIDHLFTRFDNIIIYHNNDKQGIISAKDLAKAEDLNYIHNPIGTPKDPSDYYQKLYLEHGKDYALKATKEMLENLIYGDGMEVSDDEEETTEQEFEYTEEQPF